MFEFKSELGPKSGVTWRQLGVLTPKTPQMKRALRLLARLLAPRRDSAHSVGSFTVQMYWVSAGGGRSTARAREPGPGPEPGPNPSALRVLSLFACANSGSGSWVGVRVGVRVRGAGLGAGSSPSKGRSWELRLGVEVRS